MSEKKGGQSGASSPSSSGGSGGNMGLCLAKSCKGKDQRFGFCNEHYEHFKFGLIKKNGEPAADYDKKLGHYNAHQAQRSKKAGSGHKVA